jgi:VCBS repeat-containing protein
MLRSAAQGRKFGALGITLLAAWLVLLAPRSALAQAAPVFSSTPVTAAVEGTAYSYSITVTDADAGDTIAITAVGPLPSWLTLTNNGNRTATLAGVPGAGDVGNHPITLAASDGANVVQQSFTITVAAIAVPTATNDAYSTPQDAQLSVNRNQGVLANDTSPGGGALTAVLGTGVAHGTLALQPDGSFAYTPAAGYVGQDSFTYRASNGTTSSNLATVTITVNDTNRAPVAANDSYSTVQDTQLTVTQANGVLRNDTDADGDALTTQLVANVAHGSLALNANGSFIYMPAAGYSGPDTFSYRANDGAATSNTATVTINVSVANRPPVAANDSYSTAQDTQLTVAPGNGVLGNDTDTDGDPLTAQLVTDVAHGTLALNANGSFVYTPTAGYSGSDTFTYRASDGTGTSNTATVTIAVSVGNRPPVAAADTYTTAQGAALTVPPPQGVLANDTDPDAGATLSASLAGAVSNGTLVLNPNGSFTYTPAPNFNGAATFSYTASDGTLTSAPAVVTITVTPVNGAPSFTSSPPTTASIGTPYTYTMTATDPDGGPLTFAAPTLPTWLAFVPPATISGTPTAANAGVHNVIVTVSDGTAAPVPQPFQITVQGGGGGAAPVIAVIPDQTATEGAPFTLNLAQFVTDADTPPASITYAAVSGLPAGLSISAAGLVSGSPAFPPGGTPYTVAFTASDATTAVNSQFRLAVVRAGAGADLAVAMSVGPNPVAVGAPATWTLTVKNQSTLDVSSFTLDAQFGGDVPFRFDAPSSAACTVSAAGNGTHLACALGPLAAGASTAVTIAGSGSLAGDVFASASVAPLDAAPGNNLASASLSVAQQVVVAPGQHIAGLAARAVAAADLDGDGFAELAMTTDTPQGVVVLANVADSANGGKRVLSTTPLVVGGEAGANGIVIADLDGDHDLDIAVAGGAGAPNRVFLAASGRYSSTQLANAAAGSRAVAVGDVNGDGFPDLVFATANGAAVFMNTGSGGRFVAGPQVGNHSAQDVFLVDLFGDALPELVIANADGDAQVFRNNAGAFALELTLATGPTTSVGAADLNNDSKVDLVFGRRVGPTAETPPSNLVWLNTSAARGEFFLADQLGAATTVDVTLADVDADNDADVIAVNGEGVAVYANSGASGTFALRPQELDTTGATMAVTGKLNSDDRIDLAVVASGNVDVFYNDGAGNFGGGDTAGPTISLRGDATVNVTIGAAYTDAGATATDAVDGDVTSRIKVTNPVNTAIIGNYTVTYNATDLSGNAATPVTRTVSVQAAQPTDGGGGGAVGLELALLWLARRRLRRSEK